MEVCGSMLADRIVATADVSARHAETKMYPLHPELETFFATFRRAGFDILNEIQMAAFFHRALV